MCPDRLFFLVADGIMQRGQLGLQQHRKRRAMAQAEGGTSSASLSDEYAEEEDIDGEFDEYGEEE